MNAQYIEHKNMSKSKVIVMRLYWAKNSDGFETLYQLEGSWVISTFFGHAT